MTNTIPGEIEPTIVPPATLDPVQPQDTKTKLKSEVSKLSSEAGTKARSAAEEGKSKAAETLESVSRATREAAEKMKGSQAEPLAGYVATAADSIEEFAGKMRTKSVDDMLDDAREMVRRSPVLVIGIAAAAGFLVSRFLRATSRRNNDDWA